MRKKHASQIAELINTRNQLMILYDEERILKGKENYVYDVKDNIVIACVEIKQVQWYQWELRHLSVHPDLERKGYGTSMIKLAETKAVDGGAKIIQCTIRKGNHPSESIFKKNGYRSAMTFYNPRNGNEVTIWQKVVSTRPNK